MSKYATGKFAKAISDRSGMEFPYKEMVREWNGAFVHVSEYEPKQPQLEPKPNGADAIALLNVRSDRSEPSTLFSLPEDPFETMQAGSGKINVFAPGHGLTTGQTVVFRGAPTISPGTGTPSNPVTGVNGTSVFAFADIKDFDGIQGSNIQRAQGYTITLGKITPGPLVLETSYTLSNFFHFTVATNTATTGLKQGGGIGLSGGPVTIQP